MGRVAVTTAAIVLGLVRLASAEVEVQLRNGRVNVRATAAPLGQVLDRLARATGMKVVYQGPAPSVLVSLSLEGRTPAEAVFGVLEGLGLNYGFVLDPAGAKVETLLLAGAAGTRAAAASPPPAAAPAPRFVPRPRTPPPAAGPDPSDDEGEELVEEPEEEVPEEPEAEEAEEKPEASTAPAGPRGNVLQPPAQPVFPSSPFAPRAPMFVPQPDPTPAPTATPRPPLD